MPEERPNIIDSAEVAPVSESEFSLLYLPIGAPILQPETTQVFLAVDNCNKGVAKAAVKIGNLGKGRLTFSIPNTTTALVMQQTSGGGPSTINFTMEPGRGGVVRQPGTNAGGGNGAALNSSLQSLDAINFPNAIRV